jgi:hypothetical protein
MDQGQWQTLIVTQAGYPVERFVGVEHTWWQNPLNRDSLRLTSTGFKWAGKHAGMVFHAVELQEKILPKQMLQLERLLTSPYYIKTLKTLYVVSETDAVMLQLHGGNLNQYLDNLQNQG